jgi:hypothetical protein
VTSLASTSLASTEGIRPGGTRMMKCSRASTDSDSHTWKSKLAPGNASARTSSMPRRTLVV